MLGIVASPFERMPQLVSDGLGLNPLLYDTGMLYHPPMLLAGYMSWSVPFAFGIAALATGRLDAEWIRATRRYALVAWIILGIGNLLGSRWAYHVLGWGGYWGWDPVENAAIMPWLTGTAYLHSVMIQERRGMLKIWNLALILITFFLAIFGTFIVRSGVISSVHSFAQSSVGPYYLSFLSLVIVGSLVLLFWRMPRLRSDNRLDSIWSREAAFVVNNLLFLGVTFAIFWGSVFPLASEAIQGTKLTVGPPYFNQTAGPIFLLLVFLMGVGPLLPWRRGTREHLIRILRAPVAAATLVMGLSVVLGVRQVPVAIAVWVCAFVVASISGEFHRGALARRSAAGEAYPRALLSLIARNNRRYGGYIVHLGVVMISVAVIGSSFYQVERQVALKPGESVDIGPYHVTYEQLHQRQEYGARVVEAPLRVERDGRFFETALPGKRFYKNFERQPASNVSIQSGPLDDLYIVLAGWQEVAPNTPDPNGPVSLLLFVNPLVMWLWVGGVVLAVGTLVAAWPEPGRVLAPATVPGGAQPAVGRA
jgi:cytochrome c-type biogenesis protein CcmF